MKGHLGLILDDEPQIKRQDFGDRIVHTWRGVHLGRHKVDRPWQSCRPQVVGYVEDVDAILKNIKPYAS